jgi:hypothetical protein
LGDRVSFVLIEKFLHLGLKVHELAAQGAELSVVVGQLPHLVRRLGGHLARRQLAVFTPDEAKVRMALGSARAPTVGFAAARIDLREGTPEQWVNLEELVQQIVAPLAERDELSLETRA